MDSERRATGGESPFLGLPDDLARLAVQRLMTCDVRWRSYDRAARIWQRTATVTGVVAAVAASVAAVSVLQEIRWLAISLSLTVAIFVPLQNAIGSIQRVSDNREAATKFELLAYDYERYTQLDLGPPTWRGQVNDLEHVRRKIDRLDERMSSVSAAAPRVRFRETELHASEVRAGHLVSYLRMPNVVLPERAVWAT